MSIKHLRCQSLLLLTVDVSLVLIKVNVKYGEWAQAVAPLINKVTVECQVVARHLAWIDTLGLANLASLSNINESHLKIDHMLVVTLIRSC